MGAVRKIRGWLRLSDGEYVKIDSIVCVARDSAFSCITRIYTSDGTSWEDGRSIDEVMMAIRADGT